LLGASKAIAIRRLSAAIHGPAFIEAKIGLVRTLSFIADPANTALGANDAALGAGIWICQGPLNQARHKDENGCD
jgi:hypothetical protein